MSTCSGTYYDDGGPGGNYSNSINNVYRTFCPSTSGTCLRANFSSWDFEYHWFWGAYDYLRILNGPAQNSTQISLLQSAGTNYTATANNSSGCLTFRMYSDGSTRRPGWTANFSCVPCAARQPDGLADCLTGAVQVCSNNPLSGSSPGPGSTTEGCSGCVTGETFSSWYYFETATSGSLAFTIDPVNNSEDLDFALYGPNVDCSTLGTPVRCSYAATTGNTGLGNGAGDTSEDVYGNGWVQPLNVSAGQVYVLMVNNWTAGGGGYQINWTGTASLDCTPISLPVEFSSFYGKDMPGYNELSWTTASENNNDYFRVERSRDGSFWIPVATVMSKGNSSSQQKYKIEDREVEKGSLYYYRIKQTDFDGTTETHDEIVAIMNDHEKPHVIKVINLLGQEINPNSTELRIEIYSDGSRVKKVGP